MRSSFSARPSFAQHCLIVASQGPTSPGHPLAVLPAQAAVQMPLQDAIAAQGTTAEGEVILRAG